jgi:Sortase domain
MARRSRVLAAAAVSAVLVAGVATLTAVAARPERHHAAPPLIPTPSVLTTPGPIPSVLPTPAPAARPVPRLAANSVLIPVQRVRAHVDVCTIVACELEPPADVHRTCYWAGGAKLDARRGTTVLTGHINWVGQGTGAFGNLARLHAGQTVWTSGTHRSVTRWRIVRVTLRPKTQGVDTTAFVGPRGPRRLYLISCGGAFDAGAASYLSNVYVLAEPLPAQPARTTASTASARTS